VNKRDKSANGQKDDADEAAGHPTAKPVAFFAVGENSQAAGNNQASESELAV
jgi:hypothetical protein